MNPLTLHADRMANTLIDILRSAPVGALHPRLIEKATKAAEDYIIFCQQNLPSALPATHDPLAARNAWTPPQESDSNNGKE